MLIQGSGDKRADSPPRRARSWRKTKLYRTKKRQRCQLNHTDLKGVEDAQGRKASITCKPINWACCRLVCTCHRTLANYASLHQEAEDSCRTGCRTPSCSEVLVNIGAQACAGQLQDSLQDTVLQRNVWKYWSAGMRRTAAGQSAGHRPAAK